MTAGDAMLGWGRWLAIAGHRRGLGGASLGPQKGETRETHTKTKRKKFGKGIRSLQGTTTKLGRHGFSSDIPRGCLTLPNICATCARPARA